MPTGKEHAFPDAVRQVELPRVLDDWTITAPTRAVAAHQCQTLGAGTRALARWGFSEIMWLTRYTVRMRLSYCAPEVWNRPIRLGRRDPRLVYVVVSEVRGGSAKLIELLSALHGCISSILLSMPSMVS